MNAFSNLRNRYQYFRINRIAVNFVSNSSNNLSPIICRYIPPTIRNRQGNPDFYTKVAESAGTHEGYMSIHTPPFLMKKLMRTATETDVFYSVEDVIPELKTGRACCDYNENDWYLDYGAFYFETRNIGVEQNILMRVHYKIDFYTGYDFESYSANETYAPYNPYLEPEVPENDDDGEDGGDGDDDSEDGNGSSSSTTATSKRIEKRVPRNMLTRKGN